MHSKLTLKVYGASDINDLKIIEENLRSQDTIKNIKIIAAKNYAEIRLDIEENKISKQQVIDLIKFGGDFKIEELSDGKAIKSADTPKAVSLPQNSSLDNAAAIYEQKYAKMYFKFGLLAGMAIMSLFFSILLGYLLIKNDKISWFAGAAKEQNTQAGNNIEPTRQPAPTAEAGPVQTTMFEDDDQDKPQESSESSEPVYVSEGQKSYHAVEHDTE